jgi:hypothetical protein
LTQVDDANQLCEEAVKEKDKLFLRLDQIVVEVVWKKFAESESHRTYIAP